MSTLRFGSRGELLLTGPLLGVVDDVGLFFVLLGIIKLCFVLLLMMLMLASCSCCFICEDSCC